jgi:hypothetical protein
MTVPEVATARGRDDARLDCAGKLLDDPERVGRLLRERPAEGGGELVDGRIGEDAPLVERLDEVACELGRPAQQLALLAHAASSCSNRAGSSKGPTSAR